MWIFVFGFFISWMYFHLTENRVEEDDFVPPFSGDMKNIGTMDNEIWIFTEPKYQQRYVSVLVSEKEEVTIHLSRTPKERAVEESASSSPKDAEVDIEYYKAVFPEAIIKNETDPVYINVYLEEDIVYLQGSYIKDDNAMETITCMDEVEYKYLMKKVESHFLQYRTVVHRSKVKKPIYW